MNKNVLVLIVLFSNLLFSQEVTLNHNIGNTIIDQLYNFTCSGGGVNWARVFVLEDFGITDEYTITSGSFAIEGSNGATGDGVIVNVYTIDDEFPGTFDETLLIGSSDRIDIPSWTSNAIFSYDFPTPITVPLTVDKILVEVSLAFQNQNVFIGGTMDSYDYSWFKSPYQSCVGEPDIYQTTYDLNRPDLNYYITVTGEHLLDIADNSTELISLSPNPVSSQLAIKVSPEYQSSEVIVYDIIGNVIQTGYLAEEMDVSYFSPGMYFLKINTPDGFISKKFIKK